MRGGFGKIYIYICHKFGFNLFADIVLKIELPERSNPEMWLMLAQYHHTSVTFVTLQSERGRVPSAQASVALHGLSCTHREYLGMGWKFNIGGLEGWRVRGLEIQKC